MKLSEDCEPYLQGLLRARSENLIEFSCTESVDPTSIGLAALGLVTRSRASMSRRLEEPVDPYSRYSKIGMSGMKLPDPDTLTEDEILFLTECLRDPRDIPDYRFSHLRSLDHANTRPMLPVAKHLLESAFGGQEIKYLELGAGMGVTASEVYKTTQAAITTVSLVPINPYVLWNIENSRRMLIDTLANRRTLEGTSVNWTLSDAPHPHSEIAIDRVMKKQNGTQEPFFEMLGKPYIQRQIIDRLTDVDLGEEKYDFIYDHLGAFKYGLAFNEIYSELQRAIGALSKKGILFISPTPENAYDLEKKDREQECLKDFYVFVVNSYSTMTLSMIVVIGPENPLVEKLSEDFSKGVNRVKGVDGFRRYLQGDLSVDEIKD